MQIDTSGLKGLLAILEWCFAVMADQVNYPAYPLQEVDGCLWGDWDWGRTNAWYSDLAAPWNLPLREEIS